MNCSENPPAAGGLTHARYPVPYTRRSLAAGRRGRGMYAFSRQAVVGSNLESPYGKISKCGEKVLGLGGQI
jgi:hypothetical protein